MTNDVNYRGRLMITPAAPAALRSRVLSVEAPAFDPLRLDDYTARYRAVFPRADQFAHFRAYVRGLLLEPGGRKNVEAIASAATASVDGPAGADLAQALQHFVTKSPWEAGRLFAAVRRAVPPDPGAAWVVHDGVFPKKGRHSAGVHRQFARRLGRKINCQVGVFVTRVGVRHALPAAARLYLPAAWLRDHPDDRAVPEPHRAGASKSELALELLGELALTGPLPVVAEPAYREAAGFAEAVRARGLDLLADDRRLAAAHAGFDGLNATLGLAHFEGRTWHGWHHHVALVAAAAAFLAGEAG